MAALAMGPDAGCSFAFVQPTKSRDSHYFNPTCTTNMWAPTVDMILASTNTVSALYVAGQDNVANKEAAVGLGVAVAVVWLSSAIYGFKNVNECRDLKLGPDAWRHDRDGHHDPYGAPTRDDRFIGATPTARRPAGQQPGAPGLGRSGVAPAPTGPPADTAVNVAPEAPRPPSVQQQGDDEDPTRWRHAPY